MKNSTSQLFGRKAEGAVLECSWRPTGVPPEGVHIYRSAFGSFYSLGRERPPLEPPIPTPNSSGHRTSWAITAFQRLTPDVVPLAKNMGRNKKQKHTTQPSSEWGKSESPGPPNSCREQILSPPRSALTCFSSPEVLLVVGQTHGHQRPEDTGSQCLKGRDERL